MCPDGFIQYFLFPLFIGIKNYLVSCFGGHVAVDTIADECLLIGIFFGAKIMTSFAMATHAALCKYFHLIGFILVRIVATGAVKGK